MEDTHHDAEHFHQAVVKHPNVDIEQVLDRYRGMGNRPLFELAMRTIERESDQQPQRYMVEKMKLDSNEARVLYECAGGDDLLTAEGQGYSFAVQLEAPSKSRDLFSVDEHGITVNLFPLIRRLRESVGNEPSPERYSELADLKDSFDRIKRKYSPADVAIYPR